MSECVHDFEIGSRYCVHCGQGAAELLYHAKARIAELEQRVEELEEALDNYRGQVDRYGNESASLALLGGGE